VRWVFVQRTAPVRLPVLLIGTLPQPQGHGRERC
jgi:hypothetical protein